MNESNVLERAQETCTRAREKWGNKNQILVCMEELNELACVLAKFPRYDNEENARTELNSKVIDEVADVQIILLHIKAIFGLSDEAVLQQMSKKLTRLERWLNSDSSTQITIKDRVVENNSCEGCQNHVNRNMCNTCMSTEGTEGIRPFYKPINRSEQE